MSDIADSKYISDYAITVTVDSCCILLDVVKYHLTLKLSTLIRIETYIVSIFVKVKGCFVKLSG
jgi:hypothetical protein